jgi:hypothetical protein
MECEHVATWIHEALDGAATPMELASRLPLDVHRHLQECAACRRMAHELLALDELLTATLSAPVAPPAFDPVAAAMAKLRTAPALDPWVRLEDADFWLEAAQPAMSSARRVDDATPPARPLAWPSLVTPVAAALAVLLCAATAWGAQTLVTLDASAWLDWLGTTVAGYALQAGAAADAAWSMLSLWGEQGLSLCPDLPALYTITLCVLLIGMLGAANWRWSRAVPSSVYQTRVDA